MASGGPALWLGPASQSPLAEGFDWLVVDTAEWPHLPRGHFRLIVAADSGSDGPESPGILLEDRGILVQPVEPGGAPHDRPDLRLLSLDESAKPVVASYRREDQ